MKFKSPPKVQTLSKQEFASYMRRPLAPLVMTGVMDGWPAMNEWSLDFFKTAFADFPVVAHAPQFPGLAVCSVKTTLSHYVDYLKDPSEGLIEGEWLRGNPETLKRSGWTLYAGNFNPAHAKHGDQDLLFRYVPALPDFIECWSSLLDPDFRMRCLARQSHHFVYLSARGGVTPLHDDFWATHAFLAQVAGVKEAFLFDPKLMPLLYSEKTGNLRKMMEDPRFADVEGWHTTLSPGEMLIIPSGWMHYVETRETSITYSMDWIDGSNWRAYVDQAKETLGQPRKAS